jgi:RNA-directed DNA polymerase
MTGKVESIDFSLSNIWYSWRKFRKGKKRSAELEDFTYHLEKNLFLLFENLNSGSYHHGGYKIFYVMDNKKRRIAVAGIHDRVVHRLLYEYLVPIYDPTFIFDAWSCRKGKGLLGAIERTQELFRRNPDGFVWRADVIKFFDNVDRDILFRLLQGKIFDSQALWLLKNIVDSSCESRERERE